MSVDTNKTNFNREWDTKGLIQKAILSNGSDDIVDFRITRFTLNKSVLWKYDYEVKNYYIILRGTYDECCDFLLRVYRVKQEFIERFFKELGLE